MSLSLRLISLVLVSAACATGAAVAADAPASPPAAAGAPAACPPPGSPDAQIAIITKPKWIHSPTSDDMVKLFPPFEYKNQKNGKTLMDCAVADNGKLENCRILQDEKPGHGYDQASLKLSKVYQMVPLDMVPEWTSLSECVRKSGPPHIVMPVVWRTHF